jgi:HSP20 family protein
MEFRQDEFLQSFFVFAHGRKEVVMNLVRWDPFRELEGIQARLHRVFGDAPTRAFDGGRFFANWTPPVDIQETEKEYIVKADLPDVKKEDVKVEIDEDMLTVEGERKQEKEEKDNRFHRTERTYGRFVRRFVLPTHVDGTAIKAEFKDGVLNVHLPKTEAARPKAIEVKVA